MSASLAAPAQAFISKLDPVKTLQNILRTVAQCNGSSMWTGHRIFALGKRSDQPIHFRRLQLRIHLYRGPAGDGAGGLAGEGATRRRHRHGRVHRAADVRQRL